MVVKMGAATVDTYVISAKFSHQLLNMLLTDTGTMNRNFTSILCYNRILMELHDVMYQFEPTNTSICMLKYIRTKKLDFSGKFMEYFLGTFVRAPEF
jgi:hypothetical protein